MAEKRESPGGTPMGMPGIAAVAAYLVLVTAMVIHGLVVLWPPDREGAEEEMVTRIASLEEDLEEIKGALTGRLEGAPPGVAEGTESEAPPPGGPEGRDGAIAIEEADLAADEGAAPVEEDQGARARKGTACGEREEPGEYLAGTFCLYPEERLFVIVLLAGALGGLVHSLRSFYWYLGNRELYRSWAGMYVSLPVVGSAMAVVFYLVIRGGFTPSDSGMDETNPFGFAAMAVLVGMFTEQAALRLKQVAETLFAKPAKGKEDIGAPDVTKVEPDRGPLTGGTPVVIAGTNFKEGAQVFFGGKRAAAATVVSGTRIEAVTPEAAAAGAVAVEIANPGGPKAALSEGFRYELRE